MAIGPGTTSVTFYVPKELKEQLKLAADQLNKTQIGKVKMNDIGVKALEEYLQSLKKTGQIN